MEVSSEMDDQNKPWETSFDNQEETVKKYSRTANRKKTKRVSFVVGLLVTLILVLSFVPVYSYLKELNNPNQASQGTAVSGLSNNQTKTSTSKVDGQTKSEKDKLKKQKASEAKAASEKKAAKAKSDSEEKAAKDSEEQAAKAKSSSEEEAAKESSDKAESTVKMELPSNRPTLYGFAAANNISVDQLYALNPGLTADNYTQWIGKDVKVK